MQFFVAVDTKQHLLVPNGPRTKLYTCTRLQEMIGDGTRQPLTSISYLGGVC